MFISNDVMKIFAIAFTMLVLFVAGLALEAAPDSHNECQHDECVCLCHIFVSLAPETEIFSISSFASYTPARVFAYLDFISNDIFRPPVC